MIPASYLFKDVFQQTFYDPDVADATERHQRTHRGRGIFAWLRHRPVDAGFGPNRQAHCNSRPALQA